MQQTSGSVVASAAQPEAVPGAGPGTAHEGLLLEERAEAGLAGGAMVASAALVAFGALLAGLSAPAGTEGIPFVGLILLGAALAALMARSVTPKKLPGGSNLATLLVQLDRFSVGCAAIPGGIALLVSFLLAYGVFPALGLEAPRTALVLLTGVAALIAFPGLQSLTQRRVEQVAVTALQPTVNLSALFASLSPPRPLVPLSVRLLIVFVGLVLATSLYVALVLEAAGSLAEGLPALLAGLALLLLVGLGATFALLNDLRERVENLRTACDELTAGHEVSVQPGFALDELGAMSYAIRRISEAQQALGERIQRVAEGHLHVEFRGRNRLGAALRQLVSNHRELLTRLHGSSEQISGAAERARHQSRDLSNSLAEHRSTLEEAVRTMSDLRTATQQMVDDSQAVASAANQSLETVERTSRQFDSLIEHQTQIEELLDTVREIADRSQILALNASLEGVRAGEAGRGFSLVAIEMRRMAERVKNAAEDIRKIVVNVQGSASATVEATKQGREVSTALSEGAQRIAVTAQQQQTSTTQALRAVEHLNGHFAEFVEQAGYTHNSAVDVHEAVDELSQLFGEYGDEESEPSVSDESWSYTEIAQMMLGPVESGRIVVPEKFRLAAEEEADAPPPEALPHSEPEPPPTASGEPDESARPAEDEPPDAPRA